MFMCNDHWSHICVHIYFYNSILFPGPFSGGFVTDPFENKLYYTDRSKSSVNMVKLETGEMIIIVRKTFGNPYGLAVDRNSR